MSVHARDPDSARIVPQRRPKRHRIVCDLTVKYGRCAPGVWSWEEDPRSALTLSSDDVGDIIPHPTPKECPGKPVDLQPRKVPVVHEGRTYDATLYTGLIDTMPSHLRPEFEEQWADLPRVVQKAAVAVCIETYEEELQEASARGLAATQLAMNSPELFWEPKLTVAELRATLSVLKATHAAL